MVGMTEHMDRSVGLALRWTRVMATRRPTQNGYGAMSLRTVSH